MITQEQYDKMNEGDTLIARFEAVGIGEFEAKGTVYVGPYSREKSLAGWTLHPGMHGDHWTITEHIPAIPATPAWHDAIVITATSPDHKGYREVFRNVNGSTRPWRASTSGHYYLHDELSDVKVLVGKDDSL